MNGNARRRGGLGERAVTALGVCAVLLATGSVQAPAEAAPQTTTTDAPVRTSWLWPAVGPRAVARGYDPPAHRYGAGHRGVDIAAESTVVSPAAGTVAFAGSVAGRSIVTIEHGDGLVTTLEPVDSTLAAGAVVRAGDVVGTRSTGGHASAGTVHFGVRLDGDYVNPLQFFQSGRRAVLLPCC